MKKFRKIVHKAANSLIKLGLFLKWNAGPSRNRNLDTLVGHILVVQNKDYSELARDCAVSFLHYHPNSTIIIHADDITYNDVLKKLGRNGHFKSGRMQIKNDQNSEELYWQRTKLNKILSLNGTKEFLMDADPVSYTHLTLPTNREV